MLPSMSAQSVDGLLDHFNLKILNVMEAVALIRIKSTLSKQKTPWRNTTTVKNRKTKCRKAERKWRKTKLQIHCSNKACVVLTMSCARPDSYIYLN